VLHESEIGPVISDVPQDDERLEKRDGGDHRGFGEANGEHGSWSDCTEGNVTALTKSREHSLNDVPVH